MDRQNIKNIVEHHINTHEKYDQKYKKYYQKCLKYNEYQKYDRYYNQKYKIYYKKCEKYKKKCLDNILLLYKI